MLICDKCGAVAHEKEVFPPHSWREDDFEDYGICSCGGVFVEAKQCEFCFEYMPKSHHKLCQKCIDEYGEDFEEEF